MGINVCIHFVGRGDEFFAAAVVTQMQNRRSAFAFFIMFAVKTVAIDSLVHENHPFRIILLYPTLGEVSILRAIM